MDDPAICAYLRAGWLRVLDEDLAAVEPRARSLLSPAVEERVREWLDWPPGSADPSVENLAGLLVDGPRERFDLLATVRLVWAASANAARADALARIDRVLGGENLLLPWPPVDPRMAPTSGLVRSQEEWGGDDRDGDVADASDGVTGHDGIAGYGEEW